MTTDTLQTLDLIRRVTPIAVEIVSHFEGLHKLVTGDGPPRVEAYWDPMGRVWTIGRGLTGPGITKGTVWTLDQERDRFERRVGFTVERVIGLVHVGLVESQLAALTSFAFNVGLDEDSDDIPEGLGDSTLLKLVNAGRFTDASNEFEKWDKAWDPEKKQRVRVRGLTRRRLVERDYFVHGKCLSENWYA